MPLFESQCEFCEGVIEWRGKWDDPEPFCDRCGSEMKRLPSKFKIIWTGPLTTKYNDNKLEGAHLDAHWGTNRDGSRTWIDTFEKRKAFMKKNKFLGIEDVGRIEARDTGKWAGTDIKVEHDPTVTIARAPAEGVD